MVLGDLDGALRRSHGRRVVADVGLGEANHIVAKQQATRVPVALPIVQQPLAHLDGLPRLTHHIKVEPNHPPRLEVQIIAPWHRCPDLVRPFPQGDAFLELAQKAAGHAQPGAGITDDPRVARDLSQRQRLPQGALCFPRTVREKECHALPSVEHPAPGWIGQCPGLLLVRAQACQQVVEGSPVVAGLAPLVQQVEQERGLLRARSRRPTARRLVGSSRSPRPRRTGRRP